MLDVHRTALWLPMQTPNGIPRYYRMGAGKYSLRRVMEPRGGQKDKPIKMETKWALYCKETRVNELQAMSSRDAAMEQAENWLLENGLVR